MAADDYQDDSEVPEVRTFYVLALNDMRAGRIQDTYPVCWSEDPEELEALMERESVEPYRDGTWGKTFRQGGPLEWYNRPFFMTDQGVVKIIPGCPHISEVE